MANFELPLPGNRTLLRRSLPIGFYDSFKPLQDSRAVRPTEHAQADENNHIKWFLKLESTRKAEKKKKKKKKRKWKNTENKKEAAGKDEAEEAEEAEEEVMEEGYLYLH